MDDRRFDALTRSLAAGASRRHALGLLGRGAAGAVLGLMGVKTAAADEASRAHRGRDCKGVGRRCRSDRRCCSGHCDPATGTCVVDGACELFCPPPKVLDPEQCECADQPPGACDLRCPPPTVLDPERCRCAPPRGRCDIVCASIYEVDPVTCACVCPPNAACPDGPLDDQCRCAAGPTPPDDPDCTGIDCAVGFVCCGGACVEACADGQTLDEACRCTGPTTVPCNALCVDGLVLDPLACRCIRPPRAA